MPLKAADKPASEEPSVLVQGVDRRSEVDSFHVFAAVAGPLNDAKRVVVMAMVIAENFMFVLLAQGSDLL